MTRVFRTRSRIQSTTGSYRSPIDGGTPRYTTVNTFSGTQDWIGRPISDGSFQSTQYNGCPVLEGSATGTYPPPNGPGSIAFSNYPVQPDMSSVSLAPLTPPNNWYQEVIARSNPSRPVVTPGVLMQDVLQIPKQLRDIGRLMNKKARDLGPKDLANQHLALQFGWLPLIDDVKKLLDLQSHVLRRIRELNSLYSSSGLRRRLELGDDTQVGRFTTGKWILDIRFSTVEVFFTIEVKKRMWATIHWKPTSPPAWYPQDGGMNRVARRIVLGLTPEGLIKGAWDVLPWTWMINWFTGFGNYLLVHSNTVPASHSQACLMNEVEAVVKPGPTSAENCKDCNVYGTGGYRYTSKTRSVSGDVVSGFNIPYIGISRLSILSALYVQRFQR